MQIFISFQADRIEAETRLAISKDSPEEISKQTQVTDRATRVLQAWCEASDGKLLSVAGTQGILEVEASHLGEFQKIRQQYQEVIKGTISAGIGTKVSESDKALRAAIKSGGDRIQLYTDECQEILSEESEEDSLTKAEPGANPEATNAAATADKPDFENLFHQEASKSQANDANSANTEQIRAQVLQILQGVRQQAPALEHLKATNPDVYASIQGLVQGMISMAQPLLGKNLKKSQASEPLSKAEESRAVKNLRSVILNDGTPVKGDVDSFYTAKDDITRGYIPPEILHEALANRYLRIEALRRPEFPAKDLPKAFDTDDATAFKIAINHPNFPEEALPGLLNHPSPRVRYSAINSPKFPESSYQDALYHTDKDVQDVARFKMKEMGPDAVHRESVIIKPDVQKHRVARDFIESKGVKELHPKQMLPGDWSVGRLKNGNISSEKLQAYIDAHPGTKYNISHSTWNGSQRHNEDDSKVLQVNLTTEQIKKMKEAGVYNSFKAMHEASTYSGHPVDKNHGLGWIRYTGSPKQGFFIDETQSDFGQDFVIQAAAQAKEAGMDVGEATKRAQAKYPSEHYKVIKNILFGNKHPSEVLHEAFHQYQRDLGHHNVPVSIHTVESKAPISLKKPLSRPCTTCGKEEEHEGHGVSEGVGPATHPEVEGDYAPEATETHVYRANPNHTGLYEATPCLHCGKLWRNPLPIPEGKHKYTPGPANRLDAPGHFNVSYHDVPQKQGKVPAKYGDSGHVGASETNEELKGQPIWTGPVRKSEELDKVAPPGFSEETMHKLKAKHGTESAFKIAWATHNKLKEKKIELVPDEAPPDAKTLNKDELEAGTNHEAKEHSLSDEQARKVAREHLEENPSYYKDLRDCMGEDIKGLDKAEDWKANLPRTPSGHYLSYHASPHKNEWTVTAHTSNGLSVGEAQFIAHLREPNEDEGSSLVQDGLKGWQVNVHPAHQRKGLATAMYQHAQKMSGMKIFSGDFHTPEGEKFTQALDKAALKAGKTGRHHTILPVGSVIHTSPQGTKNAGKIKVQGADGKEKWRSVRANLVMDPQGQPTSSRHPQGDSKATPKNQPE